MKDRQKENTRKIRSGSRQLRVKYRALSLLIYDFFLKKKKKEGKTVKAI